MKIKLWKQETNERRQDGGCNCLKLRTQEPKIHYLPSLGCCQCHSSISCQFDAPSDIDLFSSFGGKKEKEKSLLWMKKLYKYTIVRLKIAKNCEGIRYFSLINMDMLLSNEENSTYIAEAHPTILAAFWSGDLLGIKSKFSCFLFDYGNLTINYWSWTIDTSLISSQKSFFMFFNFIFENVIF